MTDPFCREQMHLVNSQLDGDLNNFFSSHGLINEQNHVTK